MPTKPSGPDNVWKPDLTRDDFSILGICSGSRYPRLATEAHQGQAMARPMSARPFGIPACPVCTKARSDKSSEGSPALSLVGTQLDPELGLGRFLLIIGLRKAWTITSSAPPNPEATPARIIGVCS